VKLSRGRKIAFLSAAAALPVLAAAAWTQWAVVAEEWYLYFWKRGGAAEKEQCFRSLVNLGSVRALRCLEGKDMLYLVDVGGRGTARRSGARAFEEIRRHLGRLAENQKFAIVWMGNGVSVFPPLEPGIASPQPAVVTDDAKRRALGFLEDQWVAGPPVEEPCIRWALLTALALANSPSNRLTLCYFGSGPSSATCRYCSGHSVPEVIDPDVARGLDTRFFWFTLPADDCPEGTDYLKDLASRTGGVHVPLRK
jgi:hypothetical protein